MTAKSPLVSVEEVMAETGLTKRQIRFDIRNGYMPGEIDHRNRIVIRRGEWNEYLATPGWRKPEPDTEPEERKPVGLYSIHGKAS